MQKFFAAFLVAEFFLMPFFAFAEDLTSSNFIIRNPIIDSGGGWSASNNFQSADFLGQPVIDQSTSASFTGQSGAAYVQDPQFTLSTPSGIAYATRSVSTSAQTTTASLDSLNVINTRGTGMAWVATINVTNDTIRGASTKIIGDNDTVTFSGTYTGVTAPDTYGKYVVEITMGGAVGAAIFQWTDPAGTVTTGVVTASSVALNNGMTVIFDPATYVIGDRWILRVDSLGYTALTLTPGNIIVNFGATGVVAGTTGIFSGSGATSNARTLITGAANDSDGSYTQILTLDRLIHPNTMSGAFQGIITLTIS